MKIFWALLLALGIHLLHALANPVVRRQNQASQFIIFNSCPSGINLWDGGQWDSWIPVGGNVTKFSLNGFLYTDANGGNANGAAMRAGFFDNGYYYMVRNGDGPLNTGMSIVPQQRPSWEGYCVPISCNSNDCTTAFAQPPTRFPPTTTPPPPPYYRCPIGNTTYVINFCPSGSWPGPQTWRIHPTFDHPEKCLDVRGAVFENGTPVQIYDCNGSGAQNWILNRGSTKVQLAGTNFCLDAGSTPGNGVGMKIWQCYDNLPAQQWYYTDDNRIALEGKGQCLDLPNGVLVNSNQVQTWQCTDNNQNQTSLAAVSSPNARLTEAFRKAGWLPASPKVRKQWVEKRAGATRRSRGIVLRPPIQELKDLIENDAEIYMGFSRMFENGEVVKDYNEMLTMLNQVLTEAPAYGDLGPPFYIILFEAMNTDAGFTAFLAGRVNAQFKKIFDYWAAFLSSPASTHVLGTHDKGWFSTAALDAMGAGFGEGQGFADVFKCDPTKEAWGFGSWDAFFVRELREGVRAVELPGDERVISAACESVFYNAAKDVQEADQFWIKGEPYSLRHILNNDAEYTPVLTGGSIFQGFLQVTGYHRWHAPVDGVVKKIVTVPGTYFVQSPSLLGAPDEENPYIQSLGFITAITTRMLIFIESDNPKIGLMCFVAIGMTEVSTCEATVGVGQRVKRGEELGMFHFGGSSHCLIFRKEAGVQWDEGVAQPGELVRVRAAIGVARN